MDEQLRQNDQLKELEIKNRKADYADLGIQRELRQRMQQDQQEGQQGEAQQAGLPANAPVEIPKTKLPRTLLDSLKPILSWRKLRTDTARNLKSSVQELLAAKTENVAADKLMDVVKAAVDYMAAHKGHRITGSGEERKEAIRTFLNETAVYAPSAGSAFMRSLQNSLPALDDQKKYARKFKTDALGAFENKYETANLNTAIELTQQNEEIKKNQIRAWGGIDAEARRRLAKRQNPGTSWKHDVAVNNIHMAPVPFVNAVNNLDIPDIAAMDDFQILAYGENIEEMRSKKYLPLLACFDELVKDGDLNNMNLIHEMQAKLRTFSQVLDQYDKRIHIMAGELHEEDLANDPLYGKYKDELDTKNATDIDAAYQAEIAEFKRTYMSNGRHAKPSNAVILNSMKTKARSRAESEYDQLRNAAEAEMTRVQNATDEQAQRRLQQQKDAEKTELENMFKSAHRQAVKQSKDQNREKRSNRIEEIKERKRRLSDEERKRLEEEERRKQKEREEATAKRRILLDKIKDRYERMQKSKKKLLAENFSNLRTMCINNLAKLSGMETAVFEKLTFDMLAAVLAVADKNVEDEAKLKREVQRAVTKAEKGLDAESLYKSLNKAEKEAGADQFRAFRVQELSVMITEKKLGELGKDKKNRRFDRKDLTALSAQELQSVTDALYKLPTADLKTADKKELAEIHEICVRLLHASGAGDLGELDRLPTEMIFTLAKERLEKLSADSASMTKDRESVLKSVDQAAKTLTDEALIAKIDQLSEEVKKNGEGAALARQTLRQYCARVFRSKAGADYTTWRSYEKLSDADLAEIARGTMKALTVAKDETEEQQAERRTESLALLTKLTGMPETAFIHIPMRDLKNLTASAVQDLGVAESVKESVEGNINQLKEIYAGPEAAKQLVEMKNVLDADFAAVQKAAKGKAYDKAKEKYEKTQKRLREQCIFIILMDGDAKLSDVEALPSTTLLTYAHSKLAGAVETGKMGTYIKETRFSTEEEYANTLVTQQFKVFEEKKKKVKEERSKTSWTGDATSTLNLLGDLLSGESQYDKSGNELLGADKLRQVFLTHKDILKKLCAGRKKELDKSAGLDGPMKELLSNVNKGEDQLIRGVKSVLDEILDAINALANKNEKAGMNQLLSDESLNALFLTAEDKIKTVLEQRDDKLEDQVNAVADDIFEDMSFDFTPLLADDEDEAEKNAKNKKQDSKEKLKKIRMEIYSKDHAHGRFIQNLTKNYIASAGPEAKRVMLGCMMKDIKPKMHDKDDHMGTARAGRYLASMVKGAGPMMQKIMQGIPENAVRMELAPTLQVVKSDLRDIPASYVNKVLEEIKQNTPDVKSIVKKKALGAASIAQTFLCEFTDMKGNKTMKVVKILRPDAEKKFEDEKDMIIKCAREADPTGVVESALMAHMSGVEKELDFTTEAKNCEKGKVYNTGKGPAVRSVKLDKNVKAQKHYMVMDKAEGQTVDQYILELKNLVPMYLSRFYFGVDPMTKKKVYRVTSKNYKELAPVRKELLAHLKSAEKRQKHVALLAEKWVDEALFGSYFHHGDLHAGNIMVNDECATVLDYGNANQLSKDQMQMIVKLMAGAFVGKTDVFIRDLGELLKLNETLVKGKNGKIERKPDPIEITEDQKKALKEKLDEVFKIGGAEATGDKIFIALMKAQEVGIKIPAEIQNFSQCEQRLENTLSELNGQVYTLRHLIKYIDCMEMDYSYDHVNAGIRVQQHLGFDHKANMKTIDDQIKVHTKGEASSDQKRYMEKMSGDLEDMKAPEFEKKYLGVVKGIQESLPKVEKSLGDGKKTDLKSFVAECRAVFSEALALTKEGKSADELASKLNNYSYHIQVMLTLGELKCGETFGDMKSICKLIADAFNSFNEDAFEELMAIFEDRVPAYVKIGQEYDKYREEAGHWLNKKKTAAAKEKFIESFKKQKALEDVDVESVDYMDSLLKPHSSVNSMSGDLCFRLMETELAGKRKSDASTFAIFEKTKQGEYVLGDYAKLMLERYEAFKPYSKITDEKHPKFAEKQKMAYELKRMYAILQDRAAIEKSKRVVETDLTEYFKISPQLKTSLQDFRQSQIQWIDARLKSSGVQKAKENMLLAKKEFMKLYNKLAVKDLQDRKQVLSEKVNDTQLTDFIGAMKKKFTWGRMVRVFNFGLGDYMPEGEKVPEEFKKELAKQEG